MHTLGEDIRLARLRRDLSAEQVAERAGLSRNTLLKIEKDLTAQRIAVVEKGSEEELALKRKQRELEYEIEIKGYETSITNATKRAEAVKLAEQKNNADVERYEREHVKTMLSLDLQLLANRRDVFKSGSREYLAVQEEYLRQSLANIEKLGRDEGETEAAYQARRLAAQRAYYEAVNANADAFIRRLPDGYHTMLKGDGGNLSQGQRQLLAIARAAVADPPVLILDEATSSIDTRTEQLVQKGMDALMAGRTTFVIAHRLSTVRNADCIMVLEQGRIIERGNHDDLLNLKGRYYELYTGNKAEIPPNFPSELQTDAEYTEEA